MPKPKYKIINFPAHDTKNGILYMFQSDKKKFSLPFEIKKILYITNMENDDKRGGHTHHQTTQILICLSGQCKVNLDNGKNQTTITLNHPNKGLILYPYIWHVLHSFKTNTSLLVIADHKYNEKEYIRNYEDFLQQIKLSKR